MRRIVFTNDKGGVGKTTTVSNLAVGLAQKGIKTLVVDMDPQGDVTYALLAQRPPEAGGGYVPPTVASMLVGHYPIQQTVILTPRYPNLAVIPGNSDLADASLRMAKHPTSLKRQLDELPEAMYQVVLIDTGKGLDPLAINALASADEVFIILTPGKLEIDAIERMQEHVQLVRRDVLSGAQRPVVKGILLTFADRFSITKDTLLRVQMKYPGLFMQTVIPKNNDLQKAIGRAKSIFEVKPDSKSAMAYQQLIKELGL